jgi:hypothetical protein
LSSSIFALGDIDGHKERRMSHDHHHPPPLLPDPVQVVAVKDTWIPAENRQFCERLMQHLTTGFLDSQVTESPRPVMTRSFSQILSIEHWPRAPAEEDPSPETSAMRKTLMKTYQLQAQANAVIGACVMWL